MQPINEMSVEFLSKSSNESFARVIVAAFISQIDPTVEEIADVKTSVSEAVTNSVIHGYENSKGYIKIKSTLYENAVEIFIMDEGRGIENIELARQPLYTSKPEMERSGMGFTVMESFMDSIEINTEINKGTTIRMYKTFKSINK